jgi:predicted DNA-binding transcriptional regulator YafY
MANVRLARLFRLAVVLRARVARTAAALAEELEVSKRTVYRDLNALILAGVPCRFDKDDGGYRINGDFFLPPVQLTLGEAMALSLLAAKVARHGQLPFMEDAWRAVTKVRSQLPASIREEVAEVEGHVHVQAARVSPQNGCDAHFNVLRRAITIKRKVRCRYEGGKPGGDAPFLFRPYALFFNQRAWYAVGHSERAGGERSLKLNRLTEVTATDRPYMIPDDWSLEGSQGKAWRMIRGDKCYAVAIRFDGEFGRSMGDTLWHATQTISWEPDGSCLFQCEVDGLDEIVWWVLAYGPHAEVIKPMELRQRVNQLAAAIVRLYAPTQGRARTPKTKTRARVLATF